MIRPARSLALFPLALAGSLAGLDAARGLVAADVAMGLAAAMVAIGAGVIAGCVMGWIRENWG